MKAEEVQKLHVGDIVRHVMGGNAYVVVQNDGRTVTVVMATTVTNPQEWILIHRTDSM